jgi:coenzyme F420-reducing hydrogenase beta subunit
MCIGCGACTAADPTVQLELDPQRLSFRPSHASGEAAASVCPAVQVDFADLQQRLFPGAEPGPHGVVDSVWLAQSTEPDRNLAASSGGLIKELLHHYLGSGEVDGIISLAHVGGLEYRARLVTDTDEIDTLPGSIYHAVAFDDALRILRDRPGRYALVAIPCQLEGIWSYVHRLEPELAERIHVTIGLLCGWQYTYHALRAISTFKGVDPDDLVDVTYRGGGAIGKLRLHTEDRTVAVSRRVDFGYQVAFDRSFNNPRCHVCIDHSNFLADIVVGDAWLPSTVGTSTGISLVVCRAPETRKVLEHLTGTGRVVASEVGVDEITESQTRRVVFGDFAYALAEHLGREGRHRPDMVGPNRGATRLHDPAAVAVFDRELQHKLALQAAGRYRALWRRKATKEFPRLAKRYLDWFLVRIVRIKSLTGRRQEVSAEKIRVFR